MERLILEFLRNFSFARTLLLFSAFLFAGCPDFEEEHLVQAPEAPAAWVSVLGRPTWRFDWIGPGGNPERASPEKSSSVSVKIFEEYSTPVLAFPYWPELGIPAGVMRPAGAIYPLDAEKGRVMLSFQGGVDAVFYMELALRAAGDRVPQNFDWLRFRALRVEKKLREDVCLDPWLADWQQIAEKTLSSGFNSKSIKPRETENLFIEAPASGLWFGTSPFAEPFNLEQGVETAFRVHDGVDSYFCKDGVMHITKNYHSWLPH